MLNFKSTIIILSLLFLASCASTGNKKSSNSTNRTEYVEQVAANSAEMQNLELGIGYMKRGKPGDLDIALDKFKKAIKINPKFALGHSMVANVFDQKGLFDSAEKHYKLSLKYNNGSPDIINNYANFLCQRGSYELAVEKYMKIVNDPQYKTPEAAYENAGVCSYEAKSIGQAEGYFREALKFNKNLPNSLYHMMKINMESENYMKARAFLQRLEQVISPSDWVLAAGYEIEKGLGNKVLAKQYLTKLQTNFPGSKSLKNIK